TPGESMLLGGSSTVALSADAFLMFGTGGGQASTEWAFLCSTAGVIDNLYIFLSAAPGAGNSWDFTLYKNGSATGLTLNISGASPTSGNTASGANAVTIAAGDTISVLAHANGTPTAAAMGMGVRWVPTISGESMFATRFNDTLTSAVDRFNNLNGAM